MSVSHGLRSWILRGGVILASMVTGINPGGSCAGVGSRSLNRCGSEALDHVSLSGHRAKGKVPDSMINFPHRMHIIFASSTCHEAPLIGEAAIPIVGMTLICRRDTPASPPPGGDTLSKGEDFQKCPTVEWQGPYCFV